SENGRARAAPAPIPEFHSGRLGRLDARLVAEPPFEVSCQALGRTITPAGNLFETFETNRLQGVIDTIVDLARRSGLPSGIAHVLQRCRERFAAKRRPAGQQRIQRRAKPVDIAQRGYFPVRTWISLLRRHVLDGADDPAIRDACRGCRSTRI